MKSWNEIRRDATKIAHRWKDAYDAKSQAQSFECVPLLFKLYAAKVREKGEM